MTATETQIPLFQTSGGGELPRREPRRRVVRHVEYCRFPRVCANQRVRVGVTRDVSPSGMCLRVPEGEPVGALLRVALRGVDGRIEREAIARVAWSRPAEGGDLWLGLELVEAKPRPLRIPARRLRRVAAA